MSVTINVNGLSLCHKASSGVTTATIPDICKTPTNAGPVPVPYPNIALSADLAKGTTTVKADGGNMIAHKSSEFSKSSGDEAGTVGGVKSGVNMGKATWITWSMDVKVEGKNACRLSDKMFMNKQNTVSMGGVIQPPIDPSDIIHELCELACECKTAIRFQNCVAGKIEDRFYDGAYPRTDSPVWREVSMRRGNSGWEVVQNRAGTGPSSNPFTPRGGIRPDVVLTDGAGNPTRMIEMKFPGDRLNANQRPGGAYDQAARDLGVEYDSLDVEEVCEFCWDPPPPGSPVPVTAPEPAPSRDWVPWAVGGAAVVVVGVAVVACYASVACGAAVTGGALLKGAGAAGAGALVLSGS